jgi:hypothetical protein
MKRTILSLVVVLVFASTALAQGIEPEGLFRLEGTLWSATMKGEDLEFMRVGFFQGKVYWTGFGGCLYFRSSTYHDFLIFSVYEYHADIYNDPGYLQGKGILFPLFGIGFEKQTGASEYEEFAVNFSLKKLVDNWVPPTDCNEN